MLPAMVVLDANVSALVFDLSTKANTYNLYGDFSTIKDLQDYNGYKRL
jgi:hypothetical protein